MSEMCIAIISGSMALLGVAVSSLFSLIKSGKEKKLERNNRLLEKKEELYIDVIKYLEIPSLQNQFAGSPMSEERNLITMQSCNIEAKMLLYSTKDILKKYHQAVEATEARLPYQIMELRYDTLLDAMRKDLGIKR